jgi:hypothetical protein
LSFTPFEDNQNLPLTQSPYFSRLYSQYFSTNTALRKNYVGLGFKPGYALQASELNEVQEMMQVHSTLTTTMISNWVNSLVLNPADGTQVNGPGWNGTTPLNPNLVSKNGQFIELSHGWYLVQDPTTNLKHWIYVALNAKTINVPTSQSGTVTVGLLTNPTYIGPSADGNLYDNSSGDSDFNAEGADRYFFGVSRLAATFASTVNQNVPDPDGSFSPLFTVENGTTFRFINGLRIP